MAERIAVIADVHANCYALQALLDYLAQQPPVECIPNLGDFVQIGPHPREVAEVVLGDPRFVNIMGNLAFQRIAYDRSALKQDYIRRAVPAREHLLARFHGFPPAAGKSSSEADVGSV